ncbi:hypothetical protein O6H91_12G105000 [Diphasiastrum complanatum]|uniref:Uncharacterized protein n=2 Tax=Diphasiastrum complanatum TaxID=34168 RepID=A0ACC2ARN1_DIPCM|nr:hypothetical protein O6H91_20G071000 [Diphasiastrum complanatum]KAJ7537250.1 hypothetical protein O6H91_12G105000 [Diphasiastrum complanatum]
MLMYGFQPRSPTAVGFKQEKVEAARNFLEDLNQMIEHAKRSIRQSQDRARHYANPHRRDVQFSTGEKVYLRVPVDSKTLKSGVCAKLSPRYCGPFTISRRLGEVTYELELPHSSKVFPVFHVSQLRKALTRSDNLVGDSVLVLPLDPQQPPHEPEEILDSRETQTRHTLYREYLVKWNDQPVENATWERGSVLRKIFPDFVLEDQDGS